MHMDIAGIDFSISCGQPLSVDRLPDTYRQFITGTGVPGGNITVNVRIETGAMPDTAQMTKIFDTGQSWAMFRQNDDYALALNTPAVNGRAIWLAVFNGHCDTISIYCSDQFRAVEEGTSALCTPLAYPLDQLLLMHILADKGGALLHAAGIGINSRGCIFPGRSGAGKSTLSRLFLNRDTAEMLSDDRIIIRKTDGKFRAFGTPWAGDANIAENKSVILERLFFIRHAEANRAVKLTPKEAVERLMPVTSIPWYDEKASLQMLSFCEDLVLHIPAYDLHFRPDNEVVTFLEDFIARGNV